MLTAEEKLTKFYHHLHGSFMSSFVYWQHTNAMQYFYDETSKQWAKTIILRRVRNKLLRVGNDQHCRPAVLGHTDPQIIEKPASSAATNLLLVLWPHLDWYCKRHYIINIPTYISPVLLNLLVKLPHVQLL